ncbi:MAG: hypothetical protein PQJ58_04540 [Spirochaetales bacterium]|nr:hypothetical protein [Spirochaetales bacterium]
MDYLYLLCELARLDELNEKTLKDSEYFFNLAEKLIDILGQIRKVTNEPQVIMILEGYFSDQSN